MSRDGTLAADTLGRQLWLDKGFRASDAQAPLWQIIGVIMLLGVSENDKEKEGIDCDHSPQQPRPVYSRLYERRKEKVGVSTGLVFKVSFKSFISLPSLSTLRDKERNTSYTVRHPPLRSIRKL
ncbi:hypothetical protein PIB30_015546 [Stylosanthes scabra]|uniref:Uncharacterized protein n=1 Tax=Stylosanthes scabra TaxID=79078 RepID=A0ABU6Z3L8_9FABA|nr:hypothetical protein [Stylosanthes scabra]